jgi:hypothetical protein
MIYLADLFRDLALKKKPLTLRTLMLATIESDSTLKKSIIASATSLDNILILLNSPGSAKENELIKLAITNSHITGRDLVNLLCKMPESDLSKELESAGCNLQALQTNLQRHLQNDKVWQTTKSKKHLEDFNLN